MTFCAVSQTAFPVYEAEGYFCFFWGNNSPLEIRWEETKPLNGGNGEMMGLKGHGLK